MIYVIDIHLLFLLTTVIVSFSWARYDVYMNEMKTETNGGKAMNRKQNEMNDAKSRLLEHIQKGDTIYTLMRHRSRSGMSRVIQLMGIKDNSPLWFGYNYAEAADATYDRKREGVKINGCGMDMGFELVYRLGHMLFGDGYALKHRWM